MTPMLLSLLANAACSAGPWPLMLAERVCLLATIPPPCYLYVPFFSRIFSAGYTSYTTLHLNKKLLYLAPEGGSVLFCLRRELPHELPAPSTRH